MNKSQEILNQARRWASSAATWSDFSNALFDPIEGLIAQTYPAPADRAAFARTNEYKQIQELVSEVRQRTGLVSGAAPTKSPLPCHVER